MKTYSLLLAGMVVILPSCSHSKKEINDQTSNLLENTELIAQADINADIESAKKDFYVIASSGLSLRSGTNLKSKRILTIPYGAKVAYLSSPKYTEMEVSGIKGSMIEVDYQGARGFVFSGFLTKLSPPIANESIDDYAKRISTEEKPVNITRVKNSQGQERGLTTSLILPATSWEEAYSITKNLFELPSSLKIDFNNTSSSLTVNSKKREKTLRDELVIQRNENSNIQSMVYSYQLRGYSRDVSITKDKQGFLVKELELSN